MMTNDRQVGRVMLNTPVNSNPQRGPWPASGSQNEHNIAGMTNPTVDLRIETHELQSQLSEQ